MEQSGVEKYSLGFLESSVAAVCLRQKYDSKIKQKTVIVTAIAREFAAFMWAIDQEVRTAAQNNYPGYWQGRGPYQENPRSSYWIGISPNSISLREAVPRQSHVRNNRRTTAYSTVIKGLTFVNAWHIKKTGSLLTLSSVRKTILTERFC